MAIAALIVFSVLAGIFYFLALVWVVKKVNETFDEEA